MRRFPLAAFVLATVSLFSAPLSANTRRARLGPPARHIVERNLRSSSRIQHPPPASFRTAHDLFRAHNRHAAPETSFRNTHSRNGRTVLSTSPASADLAGRHGRALAAEAYSGHAFRRQSAPETKLRARLDIPSQPTPVVSVIRPTSDKPQLPSVQEAVLDPIVLPALYNEHGRLIMPAPLLGSHEILLRQNEVADQDGLGRVQDDADLAAMRDKGMLVPLPVSEALRVDDRLPYNRRFCRPWTAQFLATFARAHYARFHTPLQVNSAVRTVEFQVRLQRTNGNAAPAEGDTASPHLTGQAVDIAKRGLSLPEIAWLRGYLLPLIQQSRVDVEEEFQQSCFHVSVYRHYLPPDTPLRRFDVSSRATSALAVAIR